MDHNLPDPVPDLPMTSRRTTMVVDGEDEPDTGSAPPQAPPPQRRGRSKLLGSVALSAVALVAGGVFLVSPYNTIYPIDLSSAVATARQAVGGVRRAAEDLVAPAARIAAIAPEPAEAPPPIRTPLPPASRQQQVSELVGLQQAAAPPTPATATGTPSASARRRPVQTPPLAARIGDHTTAPAASPVPPASAPLTDATRPADTAPPPAAPSLAAIALPPIARVDPARTLPSSSTDSFGTPPFAAPAPASSAAPELAALAPAALVVVPAPARASSPAARDTPATTASTRGVPMNPAQESDVAQAIAQMATMNAELRTSQNQLRDSVAAMREKLDSQLQDFGRRLALAEMHRAMAAAQRVFDDPPPASAAPPLYTPASTSAVTSRSPVPPSAPGARADEPRRRYRVQAASPGLALLSDIDRTGTGGTQLQVVVGDDVPGYGRVTGIAQQGSAWVVRAERGVIQ